MIERIRKATYNPKENKNTEKSKEKAINRNDKKQGQAARILQLLHTMRGSFEPM